MRDLPGAVHSPGSCPRVSECVFSGHILDHYYSEAQREKSASPSAARWKPLIPKIQFALGVAYSSCNADHRVIEIIQIEDITGDNEPEALVEYCRTGTYTSEVALMRLEYGKPIVARFRDSNG